jgi:hypothetical protein
VIVEKPFTVEYRAHETNSIRSVESIVNGFSIVIDTERSGQYPGGAKRRPERFACIGGIAALWVKYAWKSGHRKLALRLMKESAPMLAATVHKKMLGLLRHPTSIVFPAQSRK